MKFNRNPVYRKSIYPWYDSTLAYVMMILLTAVFLFIGIVGISTARATYAYNTYVWMPTVITVLSGIVLVSNVFRLVKKLFRRLTETVSRIDLGEP